MWRHEGFASRARPALHAPARPPNEHLGFPWGIVGTKKSQRAAPPWLRSTLRALPRPRGGAAGARLARMGAEGVQRPAPKARLVCIRLRRAENAARGGGHAERDAGAPERSLSAQGSGTYATARRTRVVRKERAWNRTLRQYRPKSTYERGEYSRMAHGALVRGDRAVSGRAPRAPPAAGTALRDHELSWSGREQECLAHGRPHPRATRRAPRRPPHC